MKFKKVLVSAAIIASLLTVTISAIGVRAQEQKFFFHVTCLDIPGYRTDIHEVIKERLVDIGIDYELVTMDMASVDEITLEKSTTYDEGGWDFFVQGKSMATPSKHPQFYCKRFYTPNWWRYSNGVMDDLIEAGLEAFTFEEQKEIYDEIQGIYLDEFPSLIFWQSVDAYMLRSDVDTGPGLSKIAGDFAYQVYYMDCPRDRLIYALPWPNTDHNPVFNIFWQGVYEPLLYCDYDGTIKPHLAESWEISDDGLTYTFHLRDDILWHDGVPFTSKDVKFTYEADGNPETCAQPYCYSPVSTYFDYIETPDDYTVIIHMKTPNAALLNDVFANNWVDLVPEHCLKDIPYSDWKTHEYNAGTKQLPGLGPYVFKDYVIGEYYTFEAFADYFEGEAPIKEYIYKIMPKAARDTVLVALEKGEIDFASSFYYWTDIAPESIGKEAETGVKVEARPGGGGVTMMFNHNHPILSNKWVKKAINYAIPREKIIEEILNGFAINH